MGALSRWSGGLLDRVGARLPLIVGPAICAGGFSLLAMSDSGGFYAVNFLLPIAVLGIGMVVTVAPLTTAVINAVPTRQAGVASGINNSVSSVASLLAVAIFGAVALGAYNHALDRRHDAAATSPAVANAIEHARGQFVIEPALPARKATIASVPPKLSAPHSPTAFTPRCGLPPRSALAAAFCGVFTIPSRAQKAHGRLRLPGGCGAFFRPGGKNCKKEG